MAMGVALRLFCCYALYLPFYGVFLLGCISCVAFMVKSNIGGILGVWRYFRVFVAGGLVWW